MEVVNISGKTAYKVGGELFNSPSGAAKSITKKEANGWDFWGI
jgi:hypothetical protein